MRDIVTDMLAFLVTLVVIEFLYAAFIYTFVHGLFPFPLGLIVFRLRFFGFLQEIQDGIVADLDELLNIILQ